MTPKIQVCFFTKSGKEINPSDLSKLVIRNDTVDRIINNIVDKHFVDGKADEQKAS